jgi:hypothetical protein
VNRGLCFLLGYLVVAAAAHAEPARSVLRKDVPAPVEAELATRESLCRLADRGGLVISEGALARSELNDHPGDDFILALCRLTCAEDAPQPSRACDQSLIFLSGARGYEPIVMPGEVLDIRRVPGKPMKLLSSVQDDKTACPVEDGVCNILYELQGGELVASGIE